MYPRRIAAGVPQGSILGPTLFLIYINDIPKSNNTQLALFADDTAIFTSSGSKEIISKHLQNHLNELETYYNKWKIKINVNKTEFLLLSHKNKKMKSQINLYNEKINLANKAIYLGLILDPKLNFAHRVKSIIQKAYAAISMLYPLINKNSHVSQNNKLLIYKMCIRPVILYAAPIWSNTCTSNYKQLQIIQNKCLRMILRAERRTKIKTLHSSIKLPKIEEYIKQQTQIFYNKKLNYLNILKNVCKKKTKSTWDKYKLPNQILLK